MVVRRRAIVRMLLTCASQREVHASSDVGCCLERCLRKAGAAFDGLAVEHGLAVRRQVLLQGVASSTDGAVPRRRLAAAAGRPAAGFQAGLHFEGALALCASVRFFAGRLIGPRVPSSVDASWRLGAGRRNSCPRWEWRTKSWSKRRDGGS